MGAVVRKAVDSTTGGTFILTGIEPLLRVAFVRVFLPETASRLLLFCFSASIWYHLPFVSDN